jgi:hypothetical protein
MVHFVAAVVVVQNVWELDLQQPVQYVPITTKVRTPFIVRALGGTRYKLCDKVCQ